MHVGDAAAAIAHVLQLVDPLPVYLGVDDTPLPLDVLYDHLARMIGAPLPPAGPAPAGVGSKRLSNARLRASGFVPQWPDARVGYAALLAG
jgi:nucleoside-diphosphate-sugar epimerase